MPMKKFITTLARATCLSSSIFLTAFSILTFVFVKVTPKGEDAGGLAILCLSFSFTIIVLFSIPILRFYYKQYKVARNELT
jgi:hypothetical protein